MFKKIIILCLVLVSLPLIAAAETKDQPSTSKNIVMVTNLGTIRIELFDRTAPITTANFRRYVRESFYNGLIFHRVIPRFVIQGGGFEPGMKSRRPSHPPIKNEAGNGLKNDRGTLSMARTQQVDSATSQFFINLSDNAPLNHRGNNPSMFGYAVFGKVIEGMDVVDKIAALPTTTIGGFSNVPQTDVVILKAYEEE